jgi:hypothetical protein
MPNCACCIDFSTTAPTAVQKCKNRYEPPIETRIGKGVRQLRGREILAAIAVSPKTQANQPEMDRPAMLGAQFPYFLPLLIQLGRKSQETLIADVRKSLEDPKQPLPPFSKQFFDNDYRKETADDFALHVENYTDTNAQTHCQNIAALVATDALAARLFQCLPPDRKYYWPARDLCRFEKLITDNGFRSLFTKGFKDGLVLPGLHAQVAIFAAASRPGQEVQPGYYTQDQRQMVQSEIEMILEILRGVIVHTACGAELDAKTVTNVCAWKDGDNSIACGKCTKDFTKTDVEDIKRQKSEQDKRKLVCHSCGVDEPGKRADELKHKWRLDHQPPTALVENELPELAGYLKMPKIGRGVQSEKDIQRLFPQCYECERKQSVLIAKVIRWVNTLAGVKAECGFGMWNGKQWSGSGDPKAVTAYLTTKRSAEIQQFLSSNCNIPEFIWTKVLSNEEAKRFVALARQPGSAWGKDRNDVINDLPCLSRAGSYPTNEQQLDNINNIGKEYGCHSCRNKDAMTGLGWIADHQPPTALVDARLIDGPQILLPHCLKCSHDQSALVRQIVGEYEYCFGLLPPPSIKTIFPAEAPESSADLPMTIDGKAFQKDANVEWAGESIATTQDKAGLHCTIPKRLLATSGKQNVRVRNPDGQISNTVVFVVRAKPQITAINPGTATAGDADLDLVVVGDHFVDGAKVRWGYDDLTTTFDSETQLRARVTANRLMTAAVIKIKVVNPNTQESNVADFAIREKSPVLTSILPAQAVAGSGDLTLTINGGELQNGAVLRWGTVTLTTTFVGSNQLTATVPAPCLANAGTATIHVGNPDGQASGTLSFTIAAPPPPAITALMPSHVSEGGPGLTLTVVGTGFQNGALIGWNAIGQATTFVDAFHLTIDVLAPMIAVAGTATIQVRNPDGQLSNQVTFRITPSLKRKPATSIQRDDLKKTKLNSSQ